MSGRPQDLQPGDILLFKNYGWLGELISWGEWNGEPREALEYSHIALVLDDLQAVEMNPPESRKFLLSEVPWERVDVFRVQTSVPPPGLTPFILVSTRKAFQEEAVRRLGEHYAFGYIAQAAGVGILARLGLGKVARWLMNRPNPMPAKHGDVCSTWAEEVVSEAIRQTIDPAFDLFPNLGADRARPSDWPTSPFVQPVKG